MGWTSKRGMIRGASAEEKRSGETSRAITVMIDKLVKDMSDQEIPLAVACFLLNIGIRDADFLGNTLNATIRRKQKRIQNELHGWEL